MQLQLHSDCLYAYFYAHLSIHTFTHAHDTYVCVHIYTWQC